MVFEINKLDKIFRLFMTKMKCFWGKKRAFLVIQIAQIEAIFTFLAQKYPCFGQKNS